MKNKLKIVVLYALFGLIFFPQSCFAFKSDETTISYINLNNSAFYDIEILLTQGDKIMLPFKQLAEIFEVKVQTNHATKEINFETSDGKKGVVGLDYIYFVGKKLSLTKNFYLKNGLMPDIKDEIFCSEKDLSVIFEADISADKGDLSVIANTDKMLTLLAHSSPDVDIQLKNKAYRDVSAPLKKNNISFDSISVTNNMMSDTISQYVLNTSQKNLFFNNNTQLVLRGKAFGGDLTADFNSYNYKGELFSFGGLGFNYHNKYNGLDYEIGRVRGIKNETYTIGNQMLGVQFGNYETRKKSYREIEGLVEKDSLVKASFDGEEEVTLSTYDGFYSMRNVNLNKKPKSIKLEELKADGTTKLILEKIYPKYGHMPQENEKKYTVLAGVTGYNNKLFNSNGYIYEMNTKKFVTAAQFEYGIKDNIKLDSKVVVDKIYSQPQNSIWQNICSADALLTSGTWKNPNVLEGATSLNSVEYIKNDNLKFIATTGISTAKDISVNSGQMFGYTAALDAFYSKDFYTLKVSTFNTSPDFYLAGGDGSYINDRTGVGVAGTISKNNFNVDGSYKKYFSNAAKKFEGGLIDFNEYSLGLNKNFEKIFDVRFNITGRDGQNSIARNQSYYYDLNVSKRFGDKLSLQAGKSESNYETKYSQSIDGKNGYKSLFSTVYLKADCKMPKKLGTLNLGHDLINYDYSGSLNKYSMMKLGYTFPEIKRVTLSLGTGYKYTGDDKGFDLYANLAYRTKSGRTINLNYQFNRMGGYVINNMFLPMSERHSINIVLNDSFAVMPSGLKSVGFNDDNRGFVEAVVYIDKNKNGKFDKEDIKVSNVPVKFSFENKEIYTKKNGLAVPVGIDSGVYKAKIDIDKLPATLYQDKSAVHEKIVRVDPRKTTIVEFPLKSCVGNITGSLKIIDDFGRTFNISEFIVVLNDEEGNEVSYSTVDEKGGFYFSGVEPGKYKIKLDESFVVKNALENYEDKSELSVDIPYTYKEFVDVNDMKLVYKIN